MGNFEPQILSVTGTLQTQIPVDPNHLSSAQHSPQLFAEQC